MTFEWNFVVCLVLDTLPLSLVCVVFVIKKKKKKIKLRSLRKMNERKKIDLDSIVNYAIDGK